MWPGETSWGGSRSGGAHRSVSVDPRPGVIVGGDRHPRHLGGSRPRSDLLSKRPGGAPVSIVAYAEMHGSVWVSVLWTTHEDLIALSVETDVRQQARLTGSNDRG